MNHFSRDFFFSLSRNKFMNFVARRWGLKLGAQHVVAGTNIKELVESIKRLNDKGITCTIDNLGEFVNDKAEAVAAKNQILDIIDAILEYNLDSHISIKPSQLGLDIDYEFCKQNIEEIVSKANKEKIFVNFDIEDYIRLQPTFDIVEDFSKKYDYVGTVLQAYLYRTEDDLKKYKQLRLRLVKGAYKENAEVSFQEKEKIDKNFIKIIEKRLLNGAFTSIATHDHHVINHVKNFISKHQISKEKFEFQMLYGFRKDMQVQLKNEGYQFCTYVPFGEDWYGYFMRRLAERPQNINLITRQILNKKTKVLIGVALGSFLLGRLTKTRKK